jgi:hypothetical protein
VREVVLRNLSMPGGTPSATIKFVMDDLYDKKKMTIDELGHTQVAPIMLYYNKKCRGPKP